MKVTITPTKVNKWVLLSMPLLFIAAAYFVGKHRGSTDEELAANNLKLVWPNVMELDVESRRLLTELSLACKLADVPLDRAATIACLRGAAHDPLRPIPSGRDGLPGAAALEVLIDRAEPQGEGWAPTDQ